jgi:hypothetical protein
LHCKKSVFENAGVGGNLNQGGFRLIQIQCRNCNAKARLEPLLEEGNKGAAHLYRKGLDYFIKKGRAEGKPKKGPATARGGLKQGTLAFATTAQKRTHSPESTGEARQAQVLRRDLDETASRAAPVGAVLGATASAGARSSTREPAPEPVGGGPGKPTVAGPGSGEPAGGERRLVNQHQSDVIDLSDETEGNVQAEYWKAKAMRQDKEIAELKQLVMTLSNQFERLLNSLPHQGTQPRQWQEVPVEEPQWVGPKPASAARPGPLPRIITGRQKPVVGLQGGQDQQQGPAGSYAEAARKNAGRESRRTIQRRVGRMFEPRSTEPLEFKKVHVKVDAREMRRAKNTGSLDRTVQEITRYAGVPKRDVFLHSCIGNSIVEFYVPALAHDRIVGSLKMAGVPVEASFNPAEVPKFAPVKEQAANAFMVKRLAFLYRRARLVKLKECILSGFTNEICVAVKAAATTQPTPAADAAGAMGIDGSQ